MFSSPSHLAECHLPEVQHSGEGGEDATLIRLVDTQQRERLLKRERRRRKDAYTDISIVKGF